MCYNIHMKIRKDFIFDVDGTLMDISHRRKFVDGSQKKDWKAFRDATSQDTAKEEIFAVAKSLQAEGHRIIITSGRNISQRAVTLKQLFAGGLRPAAIYMREDDDFRSDDVLKSEFLDTMRKEGFNPTVAFDDRQQVVDMWRARGLTCVQVAEGDF